MKFRKVMTTIGSLRKQEFYDFDLTKEQLEEAKKRTYANPLLINETGSILSLYHDKGELRLNFFISYYGFIEGLGHHKPKEFDNMVLCSCGKKFPQGKRKLGMDNWKKHFRLIQELKKEYEDVGK